MLADYGLRCGSFIDSWMRNELTDSLLAAPDLMEPPPLPTPPPPTVPRPRPHFTVSLLFEGGIDKDAARWLGGTLSVRFGAAKVILGFQLLREGQLDEAQRCFESAQKNSLAQIRDRARTGLAAVAARR